GYAPGCVGSDGDDPDGSTSCLDTSGFSDAVKLAKEADVQLLATGDCHYLTAQDREAHEVMLSIQTHKKLEDPDRFTFGDCRVHARTANQMLELFPERPEAIWNSGKIADRCNFDFQTDKLFFPEFQIPEKHTPDSLFQELCKDGLKKLFDNERIDRALSKQYEDRLKLEMDLIIDMGFVGYFLVVSDFIQWARRNKIPVGPGRGSAAGSLVAWSLEITNIDPIKYNLLFERFLNPERVTMPDIDIDFCIEGREVVINYCRDKYGHDKVCQIITFGTMMAKGVIKDVARVLGFPFEDSKAITDLIPDQLKITLSQALEMEPRLKNLVESNTKVKRLFDLALRLEGLTRHASKHAAGIVISPDPIDEVLPVYVPSKSNELVTQYAMSELESIGFLKIDFLGLKNLTLIDRAVKMIKKNHGVELDMDMLPLDDEPTFELVRAGNTSGVFQLESDGLKDVLRRLKPDKFEDIIAVNALYRPGPLGSGMVDDFIERRHGRAKIKYLLPELEPILAETYGVIVYQEQVMKIASTISGYSLGEADILRRAMGKKKVEVMAAQKKLFLQRSNERDFDAKKSEELFDLMAYFAGYGFNKSHSAAYAMIAYQTAYLKANYPAEFMACLVSLEATNADKMSFYLQECKEMAIEILPPDINHSLVNFTVIEGKILFGLHGIKNVGLTAIENIIEKRSEKPFTDILDLCLKVDMRTVNKRVLQNLTLAGALDLLPGNRAQKVAELPQIFEMATSIKRARITGQMGLFSADKSNKDGSVEAYQFSPLVEYSDKEKLDQEKLIVGFYLSAQPLDSYRPIINSLNTISFEQAWEQHQKGGNPFVTCIGLMQTHRVITTKKGSQMAFATLEDYSGKTELVIFPKAFTNVEKWLDEYNVFIVTGTIDTDATSCKILVQTMIPADLLFQEWPGLNRCALILPSESNTETVDQVCSMLEPGPLKLHLQFEEDGNKLWLASKKSVTLSPALLNDLDKLGVKAKIQLFS
ncbi:DNA polymerase III subunit alpha, partial [bacterium]|nr:DNA polymerase III subunit alpha [bacterium]